LITNIILLSFYCSCAKCCGIADNFTKSGVYPEVGRTIAAPRNIPFGTRVYVEKFGVRVVEDRLSKKYERKGRWDLYVNSHKEAQRLGIQKLKVIYGMP
jgi:peptidoglycan DL-endopeptidase CwlO